MPHLIEVKIPLFNNCIQMPINNNNNNKDDDNKNHTTYNLDNDLLLIPLFDLQNQCQF